MKKLIIPMILATMISCEGGGGSNETTTANTTPEAPQQNAPVFDCTDKTNLYNEWKLTGLVDNVGTWDVTLDLSMYVEGTRVDLFLDFKRTDQLGVGGADYKVEFTGDGCNGIAQIALPTSKIGAGINGYDDIIFRDGVETYEILNSGDQLKLCDGANCYTYDKID